MPKKDRDAKMYESFLWGLETGQMHMLWILRHYIEKEEKALNRSMRNYRKKAGIP